MTKQTEGKEHKKSQKKQRPTFSHTQEFHTKKKLEIMINMQIFKREDEYKIKISI